MIGNMVCAGCGIVAIGVVIWVLWSLHKIDLEIEWGD